MTIPTIHVIDDTLFRVGENGNCGSTLMTRDEFLGLVEAVLDVYPVWSIEVQDLLHVSIGHCEDDDAEEVTS